ncbi:MAG: class I SAM-dependent methyltransferase [Melioribacter sp.]|nr:class I SAM-dependent methyltransferase [Melioribacter sp.]
MVEVIKSRKWDCVYIDGNHDYDIVKQDLLNCYQFISNNGLIALDDSALYTDFKPPKFSFKGHPGPSFVANEIFDLGFEELVSCGHLRVFTPKNSIWLKL